MKILSVLPCAATVFLVCGGAAAQSSGTAHPEALNDDEIVRTAPVEAPSAPTVLTSVHTRQRVVAVAAPEPVEREEMQAVTHPAPAMKVVAEDDNSGVVIQVRTGPNELPVGTRLLSKLEQEISTRETQAGTQFRAVLAVDTYSHGRVVLPQGTLITGRIAQIHGGRRISGPSVIQMQPEAVLLPNGARYRVYAQVSGIDRYHDSKVNAEGTIVSNSHGKTTAGVLGFTTGTAAIAGAMVGGGIGAAVGAGVAGGVGVVWWLKQDRQQMLPKGMDITFSLDAPLRLDAPVAYQAQSSGGGR